MQIKPLKPVVLVVLDGWGVAPAGPGNAISLAKKPNWDYYYSVYPHANLDAAGQAVGLPKGEAGNSEVGHLNLGAGRIVYQELPRISQAVADGSFLTNQAFQAALKHAVDNNSKLHLLGLVGNGVVHSSIEHLYALLWLAKEANFRNVILHLFTDGRDSPPTSGLQLISEIQDKINLLGAGRIGSIMGRYWSMDRNKHWDRVEKAYLALTEGAGQRSTSAAEALKQAYEKKVTDEFVEPTLIPREDGGLDLVADNDSVIFFNFRPDRARQLTQAFVLSNFTDFARKKFLKNLFFVSMTAYEKGLPVSAVAFPDVDVPAPLAAALSFINLRQLHIGETEKYAHVTYFFNGEHEDPYPGEDRVHIPSPKVATYDQMPEMSAPQIADYVVARIRESAYDFYMVNFANPDMVGHTGSIPATIQAIETVDVCIGKIARTVLGVGGALIITSDHGNAETMIDPITGKTDTEHTSNPVPVVIVAEQLQNMSSKQLLSGILADIAPTILALMGINKPGTMTGRNLLA